MLPYVGREHYRSLSHREMPDGGAVMSPSLPLPELHRWSILLITEKLIMMSPLISCAQRLEPLRQRQPQRPHHPEAALQLLTV